VASCSAPLGERNATQELRKPALLASARSLRQCGEPTKRCAGVSDARAKSSNARLAVLHRRSSPLGVQNEWARAYKGPLNRRSGAPRSRVEQWDDRGGPLHSRLKCENGRLEVRIARARSAGARDRKNRQRVPVRQLASLIGWLHDQLQSYYGDLSNVKYYDHPDNVPLGRRLAEQFAVIHNKVKAEKAGEAANADEPTV
jgi:hypothetical protein